MEKILTQSEPLQLAAFDLKDREVKAIESRRTIGLRPWYVPEQDVSTTKKVQSEPLSVLASCSHVFAEAKENQNIKGQKAVLASDFLIFFHAKISQREKNVMWHLQKMEEKLSAFQH